MEANIILTPYSLQKIENPLTMSWNCLSSLSEEDCPPLLVGFHFSFWVIESHFQRRRYYKCPIVAFSLRKDPKHIIITIDKLSFKKPIVTHYNSANEKQSQCPKRKCHFHLVCFLKTHILFKLTQVALTTKTGWKDSNAY